MTIGTPASRSSRKDRRTSAPPGSRPSVVSVEITRTPERARAAAPAESTTGVCASARTPCDAARRAPALPMAWANTGRCDSRATSITASSGPLLSSIESGNATASAGHPVTHTLRRSAPASRSARARARASSGPFTVAPPNSHTPPFDPIHDPAAITVGPGMLPAAIESRSRTPAPPADPRSTTVVNPASRVARALESASPPSVRCTWASMSPGRTTRPVRFTIRAPAGGCQPLPG